MKIVCISPSSVWNGSMGTNRSSREVFEMWTRVWTCSRLLKVSLVDRVKNTDVFIRIGKERELMIIRKRKLEYLHLAMYDIQHLITEAKEVENLGSKT